jgi:hypothetical protein
MTNSVLSGTDTLLPDRHHPFAHERSHHVVMVVPRGEAVRNFLYSDTLRMLSRWARVTLLTVVDEESFVSRFRPYTEQIIPLKEYPQHPLVSYLRTLTENAHDRWLWSEVARNNWELRDLRASNEGKTWRRNMMKMTARVFANRPSLQVLTHAEQYLNWKLRTTREFDELFSEIKPDLVFNCSHIHGMAGELPLRVASRMGIRTAGFIFSWDNLTSRSRIFVPYDYYLVWNEQMRNQLLSIYPDIKARNVFVTGSPQFDYHFKPEFQLTREDLCRKIGIDPARPYVLYTTGISRHFLEEHRHVEAVIRHLKEMDTNPKAQLVVRTYVKGTSPEMKVLAARRIPDVVFPPVLWEQRWQTPMYEDLALYSSLLRHAALSINAASTVTLEMLMLDKPVINLDFDPPGTYLPWCKGFSRHIRFDHFRPIAESGATMIARSGRDMREMLYRGLTQPEGDREQRKQLIREMFGNTLDGHAGERVAERLAVLAGVKTW